MTRKEFEEIEGIHAKNDMISENDLAPFLDDRTLLYGYKDMGETYHVYLKNQKIHAVVYKNTYCIDRIFPENMIEVPITSNQDYVTCKRLYPECCDVNFCTLLKSRGERLPFTGYNEDRKPQKYYGFTWEERI
jgi:hypothetical protein